MTKTINTNRQLSVAVFHALFWALCTLAVTGCNDSTDQQGSTPHNNTPGVVTTPPHDTTSVVTPPPTNDSSVINPDSMGTSR
jgi:hypothetical protein